MIDSIITLIESKQKEQQNIVVGIDGRAAAGKSTIAKYLKDYFNALVIHTDHYFLPVERKTPARLSEPGGNIDYERLEKEVFHHINDEIITTNEFDCKNQALRLKKPNKRTNIVIVEGVYSLHPKFQPYYDIKIFIDIEKSLQYERIKKRNGLDMFKRFQSDFLPLEETYFSETNIKNKVDLYLTNS